jgi:hypothetical protein
LLNVIGQNSVQQGNAQSVFLGDWRVMKTEDSDVHDAESYNEL